MAAHPLGIKDAVTFDDLLLEPGFSEVLPRDVEIQALLCARKGRELRLNIPLCSAAMDSVTERATAIAIAQEGGLGIIHKNLTPTEQAAEVLAVKKYEAG